MILASTFYKFEVGAGPVGENAFYRLDVDDGAGGSFALYKLEVLGAGPLGLDVPDGQVHGRLGITVDGVELGYEGQAAAGGIEAESAPEGWVADFAVPGWSGSKPEGATIGFPGFIMPGGGSPPGDLAIDIWHRVEFDGVPVTYPLLTGGIAAAPARQPFFSGPQDFVAKDYLSRFEHVTVVYKKAAGTGKHAGLMLTEILVLAGAPDERIAIDPEAGWGDPLLALFELACERAIDACRKIAESFGHVLAVSAAGNIIVRHAASVDEEPAALIATPRFELDEVDAGITSVPPVKRTYIVTGFRPQPAAEGDGLTTSTVLESETRRMWAQPVARWQQGTLGAISAVPGAPVSGFLPEVETITQQVWVTTTYREGCLVSRRTVSWNMKLPEVPRYETAAPASPDGKPYSYKSPISVAGGVYFFADVVVKDDDNLSYAWASPALVPTAITVEEFYRDEFIRAPATVGPPGPDVGQPVGWRGRELRVVKSEGSWRMDEAPLKVRVSTSTAWDVVNVIAQRELRGNGDPIEGQERLFVGPQNPFRPGTDNGYPPSGSAFGDDLGLSLLAGLTRPFWSSVNESESVAFDPEVADAHFNLVELNEARAISKPGTHNGVFFPDNTRLDTALERIALVPALPDSAIRVTELVAGWISSELDTEQDWARASASGPALWQWQDEATNARAGLIGREFATTEHVYTPEGGGTHTDRVTLTDADGRLLPSTTTTGNPSYSPIARLCEPEIDALESIPVQGICTNGGEAFIDGVEVISFDFGIEQASWAAELACILQRVASAPEATFALDSITSILMSGSPVRLTAPLENIDPDAYGRLSNAWVLTVRYSSLREEDGRVRPITVLVLKLAVA